MLNAALERARAEADTKRPGAFRVTGQAMKDGKPRGPVLMSVIGEDVVQIAEWIRYQLRWRGITEVYIEAGRC